MSRETKEEEEIKRWYPERQARAELLVAKFIHSRLSYRQKKEMQHAYQIC